MDNLRCSGEEESLLDCRHRGIGIHSCSHNEDASVHCYNGKHMIIYKNHRDYYFFISLQTLGVKMEKYVWLMELTLQEEWKFVSVVYGEQCVMILGVMMMLELSAENLDLWMIVRTACKKITVIMIHFMCSCNSIQSCQVWTGRRTNTS